MMLHLNFLIIIYLIYLIIKIISTIVRKLTAWIPIGWKFIFKLFEPFRIFIYKIYIYRWIIN